MDQPGNDAPRSAPPPDDDLTAGPSRPSADHLIDPDDWLDEPVDPTPRSRPRPLAVEPTPHVPRPGPSVHHPGSDDGPAPSLPAARSQAPTPGYGAYSPPSTAISWYRTDQQRYKSVYRRANPWYRRLARGVIGLSVIALVGVGVYVGVTELNDYLDRDKLPGPAPDAVAFRSTAFLVTSMAPGPEVDGTLTIDSTSRAFQFVGGVAGPQANTEVVSPDGERIYVRVDGGQWRAAGSGDDIVSSLESVIPHLLAVIDSDDVLLTNLRKGGYIELVEKSKLGPDDNAIDRYEMLLNTDAFAADYPLQWQQFTDSVVPSMVESDALPLTMSIDDDDVVVGIDDEHTHFAWQRLTYADTPFTPLDPATGSAAIDTEPASTDG